MVESEDQFERRLRNHSRDEFDLAEDIDALCHRLRTALKRRHVSDDNPGSLPHNQMFVRSWRLYHAIYRLCGQGYALEGMALTRSLWETRVQLGFLCAELERRTDQFLRYQRLLREARYSIIAEENPEQLQKRGLLPPDIEALAGDIADFIVEFGQAGAAKEVSKVRESPGAVVRHFRSRHKNWMLRSIYNAADSFGAIEEYEVFYPIGSDFAHGRQDAYTSFTWYEDGKSIIEAGPSLRGVKQCLVSGVHYMFLINEGLDATLSLNLTALFPPLISRLDGRMQALGEADSDNT